MTYYNKERSNSVRMFELPPCLVSAKHLLSKVCISQSLHNGTLGAGFCFDKKTLSSIKKCIMKLSLIVRLP